MKTFIISAELTISVTTVVSADTEEEALEIAASRPVVGLCHQCGGGSPSQEWVTSGELDGEPINARVV